MLFRRLVVWNSTILVFLTAVFVWYNLTSTQKIVEEEVYNSFYTSMDTGAAELASVFRDARNLTLELCANTSVQRALRQDDAAWQDEEQKIQAARQSSENLTRFFPTFNAEIYGLDAEHQLFGADNIKNISEEWLQAVLHAQGQFVWDYHYTEYGSSVRVSHLIYDEQNWEQVISNVTALQREKTKQALRSCPVEVHTAPNDKVFYIEVRLTADGETSCTVIEDFHTHITRVEHNGVQQPLPHCGEAAQEAVETDRSHMTVEGILEYAETVDLEEVRFLLERQIQCNTAISEEGLKNLWGAQVGRTILKAGNADVYTRAVAAAAAGSDARMSGCELPVGIVSGSGNQGMTATLPVIAYAKEIGATQEKLLRAVLISDLITIHQKTGIGRLSAFCGATSAGIGAACGIAWLDGGDYEVIAHTIVNGLAILSGMVCDGAKPSCAAKIATAVRNGLLGYQMYRQGCQFYGGDGIVTKGVENTIANVGRLANRGMRSTDCEILNIMIGN